MFGCHCSLGGEVGLVSHEELVDIFTRIAIDFVEPLLHVVERFSVSDVVDYNDAVCASVVAAGDGAEALLAGSVPLHTHT